MKVFFCALSYKPRPYLEVMAMRLAVTYTPYATSSKEQTGDVITITQSEEKKIWTETRNDAESGDKYDDNSIIPPLLTEEERMRWILEMSQMMNIYLRRC